MAASRKGEMVTHTSAVGEMLCDRCDSIVRPSMLEGRWWCDGCDSDPTVQTLTSHVHKGAKVTVTKRKRK